MASRKNLDLIDKAAGAPRVEPTPATASEVATNANIDTISDVIKRVGATVDTDKATVATALMNTFNLAVQRIGGRQAWTPRDFMAYGLALAALEQVQPATETDYSSGRREINSDQFMSELESQIANTDH